MTVWNLFTRRQNKISKSSSNGERGHLLLLEMKAQQKRRENTSFLLTTTLSAALAGWKRYLGHSTIKILQVLADHPLLVHNLRTTGIYSNSDLLSGFTTEFFLDGAHIYLDILQSRELGLLVRAKRNVIMWGKLNFWKLAILLIFDLFLISLAVLMKVTKA